jgi:hypothetical protein
VIESAKGKHAAVVAILLSEYDFVSSLVPFYRRVEITVLGGAGLTISALLGLIAALEGGESPNRAVEADILALASWVPALLLVLELMALVRIARASAYIRSQLYPLAVMVTGQESVLQWEFGPTTDLLSADELRSRVWQRSVKWLVSSAPVVVALVAVAVALPVAASAIDTGGVFRAARLAGYLGAVTSFALASYGIAFTIRYEGRSPTEALRRATRDSRHHAHANTLSEDL